MVAEIDTIVKRLLRDAPAQHRLLVGIDGVDGSGKSTFAVELVRCVSSRPVVLIHVDDFLNPSSVRHRLGRTSPEGFWLDTYNYDAFRSDVLEPLGPGGNGLYRESSYDSAADEVIHPPLRQAGDNALVVVEGMFLHRDDLSSVWDYSLFIDVPFEETTRRMADRDGSHPNSQHKSMRRYVAGQQLYFTASRPWERATLVIDNTDPARPTVIAPESVSAVRRV